MIPSTIFRAKYLAEEVSVITSTLQTGRRRPRQGQITHVWGVLNWYFNAKPQCLLLNLPFSLPASQNHLSIPAIIIESSIPVFHMHIHSDSGRTCPSFYLQLAQNVHKCIASTLRQRPSFCFVHFLHTAAVSWPTAGVSALQCILLRSFCLILDNWVIHSISCNNFSKA